jgi:hypothetical protein
VKFTPVSQSSAQVFVAPAFRRLYQKRADFTALSRAHLFRSPPRKYFSRVHRFFISQFWNLFLTSGAHTRKRTIASLRWIGSLLRGENGLRSECANRQHLGNATHRGRSKKNVSKRGGRIIGRPFCILRASCSKFPFEPETRRRVFGQARYSSPEALAAAPCSRAGQMDS